MAVALFQDKSGLAVAKSGLHVNPKFPFLEATPDGLVNDDIDVEVKCPYAGRNDIPKPGRKFPFLRYNSRNDICINEHHPYYCQIQGQMTICECEACYFVVYCPCDGAAKLVIDYVPFDVSFWQNELLPQLQ